MSSEDGLTTLNVRLETVKNTINHVSTRLKNMSIKKPIELDPETHHLIMPQQVQLAKDQTFSEFNRDYLEWAPFWEHFSAAVDNNADIALST